MTDKEREEEDLRRARCRFAPLRYSLGDPYQSPNAPYFAASAFITAGNTRPYVPFDQRDKQGVTQMPYD
jgi:hypothetical protein